MNDAARDELAAAGLRGHRQVKREWHDPTLPEGECGLGVLHVALHAGRFRALKCWRHGIPPSCEKRLNIRFDLTAADRQDLVTANDCKGWSFLDMARKIGVPTE
jgi:hypothetical protein